MFLLFNFLVFSFAYASKVTEKCTTCKDIVKNFQKGIQDTGKKNHFGGGDTAWEESKLGSYAKSETRLLEILEKICVGASKESRCHAMVEEHEELLEDIWFNKHESLPKLEEILCINELKVCCPEGKYGKNCKECPGGASNPCFGRGKCSGSGTRGGDGKCDCDDQYEGDNCEDCADDYYDAGDNTCQKCDASCDGSCTDGTPKGCEICKAGYDEHPEHGCTDKNECEEEDICKDGMYCTNTLGSFKCNDCDKACESCTGAGRLTCVSCKDGWKLREEGKGCDDINECEESTHRCTTGTHCTNTDGAYKCQACHKACANGCNGSGPNKCTECAQGYKMEEDGSCKDVNECLENKIQCPSGEVCVNKEGPDQCEACDSSCIECSNTSPDGCLQCKSGFILENGKCNDIDECLSNPCNAETETCLNSPGTFKCKCKKGWARTKKGDCIKSIPKKGKDTNLEQNAESKTTDHHMNEDEFRRDMEDGKFLNENHLRFGSLMYAILFAMLIFLFKMGRYYLIAILVLLYGFVIAYINNKYKLPVDE